MITPSPIVVTDRASLAENFANNSRSVLCEAAFGAGAYAIGSKLLGFPALPPQGRVATAAALVAGLALCPGSADPGQILGEPPGFDGGQCPTVYRLAWSVSDPSYMGSSSGISDVGVQGPVRSLVQTTAGGSESSVRQHGCSGVDGLGQPFSYPFICGTFPIGSGVISLVRSDGLPDDCGNAPNIGGQIITNNNEGDVIDQSTVIDNSTYSTVIPVIVNLGGINNTFNLKFGPIKIGSLLPLNFDIEIGGSNFRFGENPDGELEPKETSPDSEGVTDKVSELLKQIRDCACKPEVDMDLLYLPLVDRRSSCDIVSAELLVPRGSVNQDLVDSFLSSAVLAERACDMEEVVQFPEIQIFAATVTSGGAEVFTGVIGPEVVSLRVEITAFDEDSLAKISLYPDSNQRKFGSVNYCGVNGQGGGDYIYVFDNSTYVPLPKRGKPGRLRVLFKPGTSFIVYDTGERI